MSQSAGAGAVPAGRRVFHLVAASCTTLYGSGHAGAGLHDPGRRRRSPLACGGRRSPTRRFLQPRLPAVFRSILKPAEATEITGATWLLIAAFFAFYFFGMEVALPVLMFVAVGDPGRGADRARCPRSEDSGAKSPLGILAFVAASLAVWAILVAAGFGGWSWAVVITACFAAAVEFVATASGRQPDRAADRRRVYGCSPRCLIMTGGGSRSAPSYSITSARCRWKLR